MLTVSRYPPLDHRCAEINSVAAAATDVATVDVVVVGDGDAVGAAVVVGVVGPSERTVAISSHKRISNKPGRALMDYVTAARTGVPGHLGTSLFVGAEPGVSAYITNLE